MKFSLYKRHLVTGDRDFIASYKTIKEAVRAQMDKERNEPIGSRFQFLVVAEKPKQ